MQIDLKKIFPTISGHNDLPETWIWCALGDYVENLDGKRIPISADKTNE